MRQADPAVRVDEELSRVVARLPVGVIVVTRRLDIVYVNDAARRLLHPQRIRRGDALPDTFLEFSLRRYARRLFTPGVASGETVAHDARTLELGGITAHEWDTATILVEEVASKERRHGAEREFVANAAHELLTPVTGIIAAAHVLEAGAKEVPAERDRFIAHITSECDRLASVARSLLILARAQSGEQSPQLEVTPLCNLIDDVIASVAAETGLQTSVECEADLTALVNGELFAQALVNLLRNSGKHGGGELRIHVGRESPELVAIDIVDPEAFDPKELARIGERFYTTGTDGGGFGLGVSIARQSLEAIGGSLALSVGADEGFHARIEVPAG